MRNFKLVIEYDGTSFSGWGKQPGKRTVQGVLEKAIETVTGSRAQVTSASRTDAGVHARGQVVNFRTAVNVPPERLPRIIQAALPDDITVRSAEVVAEGFDARRKAKKKLYSYLIAWGGDVPAAVRRYVWQFPSALDVAAMKKTARALVGRHNFKSFTLNDKRRKLVNPVREIYSIKFRSGKLKDFFGDLGEFSRARAIKIDVEGSGFLYKMVRGIVGTLVDVGRGKIAHGRIKEILSAQKRSAAGRTAPAKGLSLVRVEY